jgi:hypothetical protein
MLRSWVVRVATVTTLLLAFGAAVASACNDPHLVLGRSQAGAGDTVGYSISGTDQGASYTLTVDGISVKSGADDSLDPGTAGTFTMPDLGNTSRDVEVRLLTTHEGIDWPDPKSILYTVPAASTTPSGSAAAPPSSQPQTATGPGKAHPRSESRSRGEAGDGGAGRAPAVAEGASATVQTGSSGRAFSETADKQAAESVAAGARRHAADSVAAGARRHAATELRSRSVDVPAGVAIPGYVLLALALVLLMGVGVIGILMARRRPGGGDPAAVPAGLWTPPPFRAEATMRGMLIEAELQEMIAEQRAAMLLGAPEEAEQLHH